MRMWIGVGKGRWIQNVKEKRSIAPEGHSKGRMDVIWWDFVVYNSEQVRLQLWCVPGDGFWLALKDGKQDMANKKVPGAFCNGVINVKAAVERQHINAANADIQHNLGWGTRTWLLQSNRFLDLESSYR